MSKFLIVDDSSFIRFQLKNILVKNGHQVIGEATNGLEALEKASQLLPDFVTLDLGMPLLDGVEAIKEIQKISPNSKIVMMGAQGQENLLEKAADQGAIDFILKPFKENQVMDTLNKFDPN